MVGLSVVLEGNKDITKKAPQVISKASMNMIKPPSPAASSSSSSPSSSSFNPFSRRSSSSFQVAGFLDHCFLCKQKLLPGRDIYMYKGDRAFCSEECRYRQIFMDEEETTTTVKAKTEHNCSLAAIKPKSATTTSPSSSRCRKGARNQANGFAC